MDVEAQHRTYADLHEHLDRLARAGLLYRIDAAVNKDTEMHPLVRWQFRGGSEKDRKAFLFSNIVDAKGRRYDIPVAVGAIATNPEIYRIRMNVARIEHIGPRAWLPTPWYMLAAYRSPPCLFVAFLSTTTPSVLKTYKFFSAHSTTRCVY
jgi:hypothetical protein